MAKPLPDIESALAGIGPLVVACSGGIDSLLLAFVAHRRLPGAVLIAHAVSPAVPPEATERVKALAKAEDWALSIVRSGEFADENYLANPVNRCYFCKSNLYDSLQQIGAAYGLGRTVVSGANLDDLGEYRPGLDAASERGVRHPWIEAGFAKEDIRALARSLDLGFADLPASPCLASRLYTGTRVTAERLRAIHACEELVRVRTGLDVVRCRIRDQAMLVEVAAESAGLIDAALLDDLDALVRRFDISVLGVTLDHEAYRPGRAFVGAK